MKKYAKLVYVAGPYRSPLGTYHVEQNIRRAEAVAVELWQMGAVAICPHANTKHFDGCGITSDDFIAGDLVMVERCDGLALVPGWEQSEGARKEYEHAVRHGLDVFPWPHNREIFRHWLRQDSAVTVSRVPVGAEAREKLARATLKAYNNLHEGARHAQRMIDALHRTSDHLTALKAELGLGGTTSAQPARRPDADAA